VLEHSHNSLAQRGSTSGGLSSDTVEMEQASSAPRSDEEGHHFRNSFFSCGYSMMTPRQISAAPPPRGDFILKHALLDVPRLPMLNTACVVN
jgi:hypothetical protein